MLLVAHDPGVRLRDIAASLDITERSAFGVITDLVEAGYVIKEKDGRRNRYHIQAHRPLPEPDGRERTVGEILALLTGTGASTICTVVLDAMQLSDSLLSKMTPGPSAHAPDPGNPASSRSQAGSAAPALPANFLQNCAAPQSGRTQNAQKVGLFLLL